MYFHTSNMVLYLDSDTVYLGIPKAKSHIVDYYYLSNHLKKINHPNLNGATFVESKTLYYIVFSTTKAEISGIFHNVQIAIPICYLLEYL